MTTNNPETHNPPAFPIADRDQASFGMSLRDYFAAKAIGLFSLDKEEVCRIVDGSVPNHTVVARFCYDLADAMLATRQKGSQP